MKQRPSWEADSSSASQEIPRNLRNTKVHYRIHKSLSWERSIQSMPLHPTSLRHISSHVPNLKSIIHRCVVLKDHYVVRYYGELLAPRPTPKLKDHPLSHVRGCLMNIFAATLHIWVGQDSSVRIATRYGLDGPRVESRWGRNLPHPSRPALGPTQPPIQWALSLFPGGTTAGAWRWPPAPSSAEVNGRVELYIYSHSGPSRPVLGWTLPLPLPSTSGGRSSFCHAVTIDLGPTY
jgi:hypothetical protein